MRHINIERSPLPLVPHFYASGHACFFRFGLYTLQTLEQFFRERSKGVCEAVGKGQNGP